MSLPLEACDRLIDLQSRTPSLVSRIGRGRMPASSFCFALDHLPTSQLAFVYRRYPSVFIPQSSRISSWKKKKCKQYAASNPGRFLSLLDLTGTLDCTTILATRKGKLFRWCFTYPFVTAYLDCFWGYFSVYEAVEAEMSSIMSSKMTPLALTPKTYLLASLKMPLNVYGVINSVAHW